ncbi:ribonuclease H-like domain-containing protein [Tanacetum coccineum]
MDNVLGKMILRYRLDILGSLHDVNIDRDGIDRGCVSSFTLEMQVTLHNEIKQRFPYKNVDKNVNAARPKAVVNAARPKAVVNVVQGNNVNAVKASACWVWKPKTKVLDHGNPQMDLQDKGVIDSGCSRHMIGNMSYLTDYEEIDRGYVAFGVNPKGGKITGKCTIKTDDYSRFTWVFFLATKDEISGILKSFITRIENLVDHKVKVIRCDNGTKFKNREMNQFCEKKDHLGKFDGKADEGFFIGYSLNSKAFRAFNSRTRIVKENLHIRFSENTPNTEGIRPDWLFDIDALTRIMNYEPIVTSIQSNGFAGTKVIDNAGQARKETEPVKDYILLPLWPTDPPFFQDIIFGSTNKKLCIVFEKLMHEKFQMSSMGELTFFLRLQVQQKKDGIFISQNKYVGEILNKFGFTEVKTASTPMETQKPC